jgi:hypothetical protein
LRDAYHQDYFYYRALCDNAAVSICMADIPPIGLYDGLRFWETLRWTIYPLPLHIYHTEPVRLLRRLLPRR